jgi:PIN domain nuclease of toxin-antitoxin system
MILLDTNALIWMDSDSPSLGARSRALIDAALADNELAVSAISFWECALLLSRKRISLSKSYRRWRGDLLTGGLREIPVDGEIAGIAVGLVDLHKDPADRFIVATAINQRARLLTGDSQLLKWKGSLLRANAER